MSVSIVSSLQQLLCVIYSHLNPTSYDMIKLQYHHENTCYESLMCLLKMLWYESVYPARSWTNFLCHICFEYQLLIKQNYFFILLYPPYIYHSIN